MWCFKASNLTKRRRRRCWKNWKTTTYRVSQEECAELRESVPYVKLYRYNPKHLYPKLNVYGDNGQRSLKIWLLLPIYWLPNTYWNWHEYVISVMLISVLNIKLTCEWHKAIKLNYKNTRTRVIVVLRLPSTLRRPRQISYLLTSELQCARQGHNISISRCGARALDEYDVTDGVKYVDTPEAHTFRWPLSP
jgi:hypothetical protein